LRLANHTYHFPTDGAGNLVDQNQRTHGRDLVAGVDLTRSLGSVVEAEARFGLNLTRGGTDDPPDGPADTLGYFGSSSMDSVRTVTAMLQASYHLSGAVATLGWELQQESRRSTTETLSQWGNTSDRSRNDRWNRAWFASLTGRAGPTTYDVGARLEDNERFGRLGTWQAGLTWRPLGADGPRLSASAGLGIKEPTFYETYATGFARGNPGLDPEHSREWEAGLEQTLADDRIGLQASYFSQRFRDLIQYTASPPDSTAPSFYNVAKAAASGVELGARGHAGVLELRASWTWLRTRVLDAGLESGSGAEFVAGQRLLRRPTNMAHVGATYAFGGRATVNADLRLVGSREDRDFSTYPATPVVLGRYENATAGARVRVWGGPGAGPALHLTFRGENLLNEAYEEVNGFPAPGRTLLIGAEVAFGGAE